MINSFQPKDDRIVYKHNQLALVKSVGRWYQCDFYFGIDLITYINTISQNSCPPGT